MPTNFDPTHEVAERSPKNHGAIIAGLTAGLVIALAADGYLVMRSNDIQQNLAKVEAGANTQISKLSEATTNRIDEQQKQWDDVMSQKVKGVSDSAAAALRRARAEADKKSEELSQQIADTHAAVSTELNTELSALKDTTSSKFTEVSTGVDQVKANVETVKSSVAQTQSQLDGTNADLKRAVGDMGVMSGLIATNGKDLAALRALGERNYFEFDLSKAQSSKKVGDVTLTLRKADMKRNRYTVDILADDKHIEKRDKTINEPVQLYVGGMMQPYEVVVNQVKKDEISGYLATPKVKIARR